MTNLGLSSSSDIITFDQNCITYAQLPQKEKIFPMMPMIFTVIGLLEPNMHKNAQKDDQKTQNQISCHYTWLLHGKNWPLQWLFLRHYLTPSKPRRRPISAAKRKAEEKKEREKKERGKKFKKVEKPKAVGHFLFQKRSKNFDFYACLSQNVLKCDSCGKNSKPWCCKCIFHQTEANLAEIQPQNHQNVKRRNFGKKFQVSMG